MNKDRLFIAIPIMTEQRSILQIKMEELQSLHPFKKWVHPEDLHITLCFLGDTDPDTAEKVKDTLLELTASIQTFRLDLGELGTFGKPNAPKILWVGVHGEMEPLRHLQALIEQAMEPLGFKAENRTYRPHITIAKKYVGEADFSEALLLTAEQSAQRPARWTVQQIVLYRTHMDSQPMYEIIGSFPLGGR
ncbi:RNA 2',3'-cyclic phosphodiesterase [Paenibacillus sp. UNC451MF]|uniref:RNA 2',3'-cyclic phosphodiesterase n=1 Tax=Paenibacillus sp. UNC451MF TaxID=1449063 RepID=UPI00069003B4|nr:RNA 2',3'-cyclic phosphodiesterase [Paenibacillus sp. UNC451MF]